MEAEKNIQFFAEVDEHGEILEGQMGFKIVPTNPAFPYVFMIDDETAGRISENMKNFRVEIKNFRPQLIEKEASVE